MNRPLTFNTFKELVPFAVLFITISSSWFSMNAKLDNIIQQHTGFQEAAKSFQEGITKLQIENTSQEIRITNLESVINKAQDRGEISHSTLNLQGLSLASRSGIFN